MTAASTAAADGLGAPSLPGSYVVTVKRTFRGRPDQIARVREFVTLVLGAVPVVDEAVLLASELVPHQATFARSMMRRSRWS